MGRPGARGGVLGSVLLLAACLIVATVADVGAVTLSGTIHYTGALGPVSALHPITVFLFPGPSPEDEPTDRLLVTTNGGGFSLEAPTAGTYYLAYLLDVVPNVGDDTDANVGEPFGTYHNRATFPGDPIAVPASGVAIEFDDTGLLPGLAGSVSYTGSLGPVSQERPLVIKSYATADLSGNPEDDHEIWTNGERFDFIIFDTTPLFLRAFLDANGNGSLDTGEPFQIYNHKNALPADAVVPGPNQTAIDFVFGDESGGPTPPPTATRTPTPIPTLGACVGDCGANGQVTVDELVKGVNIALGSASVTDCPAFDADGNSVVTVDELVKGVNAALNGCRSAGTIAFVLGGTSGSSSSGRADHEPKRRERGQSAALVAGDGYIVSPSQARITFTSVEYRGADGNALGTSTFSDCTVIYDRSLPSGTTLQECPSTAPVGDISQITVHFDKTLQLLVNDSTTGIYTDPSSTTGYTTADPDGGAGFVPLKIMIGDDSPTRGTPIIFPSPISIAAGSAPKLFITTDMIHTVQLNVNSGGTTLSPADNVDPVALFGGPTPGTSLYYSGATTIDAIKVQGTPSLRVFTDQAGNPLYLFGGTCGVDGPKGAWSSPPIGATIGGWLGKDANNVLAWALPTDTSYSTYSAYFVMAEQTVIGQTTTLNCEATASPPPPADGKTYSSGAPAMPSPDTSTTLTLLAK